MCLSSIFKTVLWDFVHDFEEEEMPKVGLILPVFPSCDDIVSVFSGLSHHLTEISRKWNSHKSPLRPFSSRNLHINHLDWRHEYTYLAVNKFWSPFAFSLDGRPNEALLSPQSVMTNSAIEFCGNEVC
jgi:hypothetical protein